LTPSTAAYYRTAITAAKGKGPSLIQRPKLQLKLASHTEQACSL